MKKGNNIKYGKVRVMVPYPHGMSVADMLFEKIPEQALGQTHRKTDRGNAKTVSICL